MMPMDCAGGMPLNTDSSCGADGATSGGPFARFETMIPNALAAAKEAQQKGKKIAGIFCEYTPRELFFAADILPICMCGGQESTIPEAEKHLPSNLCPLIKSSFGHAVKRSNPFMEMSDLLVGETTCDGKKKMYELLGKERPVHVMELPQKPDTEAAFQHWMEELRELRSRLEELAGRSIGDADLVDATKRMNEERALRREIAYLAAAHPPRLTGREILLAKSSLSLIPCDLAAYRDIIQFARGRNNTVFAGRPRILLTGVPIPHGAEKVMNILEESGAVVVAQENCTGLKPILDDVPIEGDILENLARKYIEMPCSCMTPNDRRMEMMDRLVRDFQPDGIVELIWQACHTYNVEAEEIRREARARWHRPYLKLETDFSPSDRAQLSIRIEAFLELCGASPER